MVSEAVDEATAPSASSTAVAAASPPRWRAYSRTTRWRNGAPTPSSCTSPSPISRSSVATPTSSGTGPRDSDVAAWKSTSRGIGAAANQPPTHSIRRACASTSSASSSRSTLASNRRRRLESLRSSFGTPFSSKNGTTPFLRISARSVAGVRTPFARIFAATASARVRWSSSSQRSTAPSGGFWAASALPRRSSSACAGGRRSTSMRVTPSRSVSRVVTSTRTRGLTGTRSGQLSAWSTLSKTTSTGPAACSSVCRTATTRWGNSAGSPSRRSGSSASLPNSAEASCSSAFTQQRIS